MPFADVAPACGINLSSAGTTYVMSGPLTATGMNCYNVTADSVVLNCAGYSITGSNSTATVGVDVNNTNNFAIGNCTIIDFNGGVYIAGNNSQVLDTNVNITATATNLIGDFNNPAIFFYGGTNDTINRSNGYSLKGPGIATEYTTNTTIDHCNGTTSTAYGMYPDVSTNPLVMNSFAGETGTGGIGLLEQGNTGLVILNTTFAASGTTGVRGASIGSKLAYMNCMGAVSTGSLTSGETGLYINSAGNVTVKNCVFNAFSAPLYMSNTKTDNITNCTFNTSKGASGNDGYTLQTASAANNNLFINDTFVSTGSGAIGIYIGSGTGNNFTNSNILASSYGFYAASANNIFDCQGKSILGTGVATSYGVYVSSSGTTVANCNISNFNISVYLTGGTSGKYYNNTFSALNNEVHILATSYNNTFWWNNFTTSSFNYTYDLNGSNYYNTSISGQAAGNLWLDVVSGTQSISGASASPFPGLYYGRNGSNFPYNFTQNAKFGCNFATCGDYAPLTPKFYDTAPSITAIAVSPASPLMSSNLMCNVTATDNEQGYLSANVEWYKNGVNVTSLAMTNTSFPNNTNSQISTIGSGNLSYGDNWGCKATAFDSELYSAQATSANVTVGISCGTLSSAGTTYVLAANQSAIGTSCFTVTAANVTIDCAGYAVTGNNSTTTYGVYSNQFNTTVKNCNIQNFSIGVALSAGSDNSSILNSSITTTINWATVGDVDISTDGSGIEMMNCNNILISNSTIRSGNGYGLRLRQINGLTMLNVTGYGGVNANMGAHAFSLARIRNFYGEGIYAWATTGYAFGTGGSQNNFTPSYNHTVKNSYFNSTMVIALDMHNVINALYQNVTFVGNSSTDGAISFYSNTTNATVRDSTINALANLGVHMIDDNEMNASPSHNSLINVTITNAQFGISMTRIGSHEASATNSQNTIDCQGATISGLNQTNYGGITLSRGVTNSTITNCNIVNFSIGIYLSAVQNNTISNVNITDTSSDPVPGGVGVLFRDGAVNNTIKGVNVNATNAIGLAFYSGTPNIDHDNLVANSTIYSNMAYGIEISYNTNNTIINTSAFSNASNGIYLVDSPNNSIINSVAQSNFSYAIYMYDHSDNNTISGTSVQSNTTYAMLIKTSTGNSVINSNVTTPQYSLFLWTATNTTITGSSIYSAKTSALVFYLGSNGSIISNNQIIGNDSSYGAVQFFQSNSYNLLANSTINGMNATYAMVLNTPANANNTITNNTFLNATNLVYLDAAEYGNVFYWNNFTNASGYYVRDQNGSNYYNTTINGVAAGNIWFNAVNGSLNITGTAASPFSGLYYGSAGLNYPYNNASSSAKLLCNFAGCADYAPLTLYMTPTPTPTPSPSPSPTPSYTPGENNGGGSISATYVPPVQPTVPPEQNVTPQPPQQNVTPPTAGTSSADATQAVSQAEAALNQAIKDGKDVSDAVWTISAARDALANGDYAKAAQLAAEAAQMAADAKQKQATPETGQTVVQPAQVPNGWLGAGAIMLIIGGVIVVAAIAGYFMFFRKRRGL